MPSRRWRTTRSLVPSRRCSGHRPRHQSSNARTRSPSLRTPRTQLPNRPRRHGQLVHVCKRRIRSSRSSCKHLLCPQPRTRTGRSGPGPTPRWTVCLPTQTADEPTSFLGTSPRKVHRRNPCRPTRKIPCDRPIQLASRTRNDRVRPLSRRHPRWHLPRRHEHRSRLRTRPRPTRRTTRNHGPSQPIHPPLPAHQSP